MVAFPNSDDDRQRDWQASDSRLHPKFDDDATGPDGASQLGRDRLHCLFRDDLQRLAYDVLGVSQQLGGLGLCISLLQMHYATVLSLSRSSRDSEEKGDKSTFENL